MNYANPMAMITWAAIDHSGVNTVGLCHGVQNGHRQIARALGVPMEETDIVCSGINHQTWYLDIRHDGAKVSIDTLLSCAVEQTGLTRCRVNSRQGSPRNVFDL